MIVKRLSEKINDLRPMEMTVEEMSVETKSHGVQVSFSLLRSLMSGNSKNPARNKLLALAKTLKAPVRYLIDDAIESPYEAVLAEARCLPPQEVQRLVDDLRILH